MQNYLATKEPTFLASIPMFVHAVENRIYNEVQIPALRKSVTTTLTTGNRYLTAPADFLSSFSMAIIDPDTGEYDYAQFKDVNMVREIYPSPTMQGLPQYYGIYDPTSFILGPTPDKDYPVELHYFHYPPSLDTAGTSWVADNFPSVILYGCLSEGYRYLKGDEKLQAGYDGNYKEALNLLRKLGEGRNHGDAYDNNQPRPRVSQGE